MDLGDRHGDGMALGAGTLDIRVTGHAGGDEQLIAFGNDVRFKN